MTPRVFLALVFALTPAGAQQPDSLIVDTPVRRVALSAADVASLPHDTATASFHEGPAHLYHGVPVHVLLARAGVRADSTRGPALVMRVVVEAADGYRVVLSLAEVDPTVPGRRVLLADRVDGTPLPGNEGPFRLLLVGDPRHSRWVRQVSAIRVRAEE
jgi:DMSO/TMAO reductase YedYZ molybdopterin-dependent catalytic subunit